MTGGSQGARVFADVVPPAVAALPEAIRARLLVTQQCRAEDLARTETAYRAAGVDYNAALPGTQVQLVRRPAANLEMERSKVREGYSGRRTGAASLRRR